MDVRKFKNKSYIAQYSSACQFVKKYGFVYRLDARESQIGREEVDEEGRAFAKEMSQKLQQEQPVDVGFNKPFNSAYSAPFS